jgi:hypothetical protein
LMRDLKPLPDHDPARATLAAAIALEAGARRDLQVAEEAASLAAERCWRAQSALDELRKVVAAPSGALADSFIASVGADDPCGTAILERSGIESRAKLVAAEGEAAVWDETRKECEIAVRSKEAAMVTAKERVERCARMVLTNSETVTRLADDLEALQADVVSARSVLRFVWGKGINGELSVPLAERIERLLWWDLTGLRSTSASAAWSAAFEDLQSNPEAELPS